jgi:hypothetical protein
MALKPVGAAWIKQGDAGEWLSISLTLEDLEKCVPKDGRINLLCFKAKEKKKEMSPDHIIYRRADDE